VNLPLARRRAACTSTYRKATAYINDKHIEVIVRQMMRWVKIEDVGGYGAERF
jgi:hypothetical protein